MSKSIMHRKDGTCYLCAKLHGGDHWIYPHVEEHHAVYGDFGANRDLAEHYGLKVYLCPAHHQNSPEAVHHNGKRGEEMRRILSEDAQRAFEERHPDLSFREIFGINYL